MFKKSLSVVYVALVLALLVLPACSSTKKNKCDSCPGFSRSH